MACRGQAHRASALSPARYSTSEAATGRSSDERPQGLPAMSMDRSSSHWVCRPSIEANEGRGGLRRDVVALRPASCARAMRRASAIRVRA